MKWRWYHSIIGCVLLLAFAAPLWGYGVALFTQHYHLPYIVGLYILIGPWLIVGAVTLFFLARMD